MAGQGFQGVYTAIITPFKDGQIDYAAYKKIVEHQIAGGVDGIVPCGTTGESPTLSHSEHSEFIRRTVELVGGRVKVIAGTGSNSTAEAMRLSVEAAKDGADGLLQVNPYYNKPTQEGLYTHFASVAEAVDIPVILYNIPGRTGIALNLDTIVRLSELENITCIKEAAGSVAAMADICQATGDDFTLLSGDDNLLLPCLAVGGAGIISVVSNLVPAQVKAVVNAFAAGNISQAQQAFFAMYNLCKAMFLETNPIPVKRAMAMEGFCTGELRLPLTPLQSRFENDLKSALDAAKAAGAAGVVS